MSAPLAKTRLLADRAELHPFPMKSYITLLRFPLAVLVVLIHAYNVQLLAEATPSTRSFAELLSHSVTRFAVPMFFVISGYLFFQGLKKWNTARFFDKCKRRAVTLVWPFLAWNLLALLLYWAQEAVPAILKGHDFISLWDYYCQKGGADIFWHVRPLADATTNFLGWKFPATHAPLLVPLWFMRDLMVAILLTPPNYLMLKKLRYGWPLLLAIVYYTGFFPSWMDVSLQSQFFFVVGAWCAGWQRDLGESLQTWSVSAWIAAIAIVYAESQQFIPTELVRPAGEFYIICAMIAAAGTACYLTRFFSPSSFLADSTFFVYASHIMLLSPLQSIVAKYMPLHGTFGQILLYLALPAITLLACLAIYTFIRRYLPRTGKILGV